jgi:predicted ester cyclase
MITRLMPRRTVVALAATGAGVAFFSGQSTGLAAASDTMRLTGSATATPTEEVSMTPETNKELWQSWLELWNGDLDTADTLIAPSFVAHFAPIGSSPAEVRGPEGLKQWIGGILAAFTDYQFSTEVGPLAEGDLMAGRWIFQATYQGGIPGAAPDAVGNQVEYAGIDIVRIEAGQIAEYWLCADTLVLLQQVGVIPS